MDTSALSIKNVISTILFIDPMVSNYPHDLEILKLIINYYFVRIANQCI